MRRVFLLVGSVSALMVMMAACSGDAGSKSADDGTLPGAGVTVQPARANWVTGYFLEALYSKALEELGYDVLEHRELENADFYQAVANGEVQYWANGWFPLHNQYDELFSGEASIAGTVVESGALQGYLVDKAGADDFGITSLADFKRPEVVDAFDLDGNGKAELFGCTDGWACKEVVSYQIKAFGLEDHVDVLTGNYLESMQTALARHQIGEHIFFYTWTPNWTINRLAPGRQVVWIEVPSAEHPDGYSREDMTIPGVEGCVNAPCFMGFRGSDINVVANNRFLTDNPAAAKLFEVMSVPLDDISNQNNLMVGGENSQEEIDIHAEAWIVKNQEMFDGWLAEARQAGS